ncbi:MAG TPA: ferritin-like fold-containing protein [Allosphingosinicella sp.]|nr:ferritin-like fold-containing protein [Allosphingosinicella sp.]
MSMTSLAQESVPADASDRFDSRYFDLISYIVSNAIAGEIMAIENYSEMVHLMPTTEAKIETVMQASEECKHILLLSKLGRTLDVAVERRIVEPQWNTIRKHFSAAVSRRDLPACLIIQDLMTETMAILLYRTLAAEGETDPRTAQVAAAILKDELEHLEIGKARLRALLASDPAAVNDALVWAHHRVMPELFTMISTSCHFLCDDLGIDCGSLTLASIQTDIEQLRVGALELYVETLDSLFDPKVTNPLIASMAAYEGAQTMFPAGSTSAPCCGPRTAPTAPAPCCSPEAAADRSEAPSAGCPSPA